MTELILQPSTQDSNAYEGNVNTNYNYSDKIEVGEREDGVYRWIGYILFDMSSIPAKATINSATLKLYLGSYNITSTAVVDLHRITSAWTETQPTWNNMPSISGVVMGSITPARTIGWKEWPLNLTEFGLMVSTNYGMRIFHQGAKNGKYQFRPREWTTTEQRPILLIDYTPGFAISQPATKGLIGSRIPNIEVSKLRTEV